MSFVAQRLLRLSVPCAAIMLAACGGGSSSGSSIPNVVTYDVSATAGSGGSISPASVMVNANGTTTFTVTPDSGYAISGVTGCGGTLSGNTYTTGAISGNCTVTASFGSSTYSVGGAITGLGTATGLVLVNGSDTLSVPAGATSFTMPTSVGNGLTYDVTVKVHPTALSCSVASGAGTVNGANVTTVSVSCKTGTESLLYSFTGGAMDGVNPWGGLIQANDGNLYGVTSSGGASNHGTVFKITPGGSESLLYSFAGGPTDGAHPQGGLVQASDGSLYGVTALGGASGNGVVYKITPSGTETVLYSFAGGTTDGANPAGNLLDAGDGNFYGLTLAGGAGNSGVLYRITPGGNEVMLDSFVASASAIAGGASVIQATDGNLYALIADGGASGKGAFIKSTLSGSVTYVYSFPGGSTDGWLAIGSPIQAADGDFYGATAAGGATGNGAVFRITAAGAETVLYSFSGGTTDGEEPESGLIQAADGNLYGVTPYGGADNDGVVYRLTLGGAETVLYSFAGGTTDGANPQEDLIQANDGTLYGVTYGGGASGDGTVFEIN